MTGTAQLYAETVQVLCPFCAEPQPAPDGSLVWTSSDFETKHGTFNCVSCERKISILFLHFIKFF